MMDDYDDFCGAWIACWQCGGQGVIEGDCTCMDDTCCCLYPEPPECDICEGAGGWNSTETERETATPSAISPDAPKNPLPE